MLLFFHLIACLSLSSVLSFTCVLYPPNLSIDSTSSWSPPKSFHIFLDYVIPSYSSSPFCCFLPYNPVSYGWQPLLWHTPDFLLPFQLSHVSRLYLFNVGTFIVPLLTLYCSPYLSILERDGGKQRTEGEGAGGYCAAALSCRWKGRRKDVEKERTNGT